MSPGSASLYCAPSNTFKAYPRGTIIGAASYKGIVALLDESHAELVEGIKEEIESRFGVEGEYRAFEPHLSLHVSRGYDMSALEDIIENLSRDCGPLTVHAGGLGIFENPDPVVFIPVVRNDALSLLHRRLWKMAADLSDRPLDLYAPCRWIPHITIASGPTVSAHLDRIVDSMRKRAAGWTIRLTELAVIHSEGIEHKIGLRRGLEGCADE